MDKEFRDAIEAIVQHAFMRGSQAALRAVREFWRETTSEAEAKAAGALITDSVYAALAQYREEFSQDRDSSSAARPSRGNRTYNVAVAGPQTEPAAEAAR